MKNLLFFIFIFLILFSSCKKELPQKIENPKFVRTWYDTVQGMPFRAKLIIKANKTFEYLSGACDSRSKSNGIWNIQNDTIILKSLKPKGCLFQNRFGVYCIPKNDKSFFENNKTIKDCEPNGAESNYEIFENEKFIIENDTLIHINQAKNECGEIRVAFSTKEKIRRSVRK
ncbi:hypothetical protein [Flavobacterium sp.]|uniref:hypothetical protein n=1 Tax=Flavobacterium sp. TaxID=239 RepID=UPI002630BC0B|nr:hypothetical protein [Flavobacterium sp.]